MAHQHERELAYRNSDGIEVALLWHDLTDALTVCVSDNRTGAYYELGAHPTEALDVFEHPYAYAAYCGVPYDEGLLASWAAAAATTAPAAAHVRRAQAPLQREE